MSEQHKNLCFYVLGNAPLSEFWIPRVPISTPCKQVAPPPFFKKITHQQKTLQNKSENCRWSTLGIVVAPVDQIKGRPIHLLKESCSGYPLTPYLAASDACSQHCFNPAAKKTAFYLAPAARLPPIALIHCPREFRAAPLARHDRGMHKQVAPALFCWQLWRVGEYQWRVLSTWEVIWIGC